MKHLLVLIIFCCMQLPAVAQKQGITGKVFWLSGNQMPGPGAKTSSQAGVAREIYVFRVTKLSDADQKDGFFTNIRTELVKTTSSSQDGSFKVRLKPGEYSVFVKEPGGLFANLFDQANKINPVVVKPRQFSRLTINIDYEAAY